MNDYQLKVKFQTTSIHKSNLNFQQTYLATENFLLCLENHSSQSLVSEDITWNHIRGWCQILFVKCLSRKEFGRWIKSIYRKCRCWNRYFGTSKFCKCSTIMGMVTEREKLSNGLKCCWKVFFPLKKQRIRRSTKCISSEKFWAQKIKQDHFYSLSANYFVKKSHYILFDLEIESTSIV